MDAPISPQPNLTGPMTTANSAESGRLKVSVDHSKSKRAIIKKHLNKQKHGKPRR